LTRKRLRGEGRNPYLVQGKTALVVPRAATVIAAIDARVAECAGVHKASGTILPADRSYASVVGLAEIVAQEALFLLSGRAGIGHLANASLGGTPVTPLNVLGESGCEIAESDNEEELRPLHCSEYFVVCFGDNLHTRKH